MLEHHKNVYVHYECEGFRYKNIEAVDDNGNRFCYAFSKTQHEPYLKEAKEMCEAFEAYCTKTCALDNSKTCDVWFLRAKQEPIAYNFGYDNLFGTPAEYGEEYEKNWKIVDAYSEYNLDGLLGRADWACLNTVETQYLSRNSHIQNPLPFEEFFKKHAKGLTGADAVKAAVKGYYLEIYKDSYSDEELANICRSLRRERVFPLNIDRSEALHEYKTACALLTLYRHNRGAMHDMMHELLYKLQRLHFKLDHIFYELIYSMLDEYYSESDEQEGDVELLQDNPVVNEFVSREDLPQMREALVRIESNMHDGYWHREMPNEYVVGEIEKCYKVDSVPLGALYILPNGNLLYLPEGHHVLAEYLYERGLEKDYQLGKPSNFLKELGWIKANTVVGYIDLTDITPTAAQKRRMEEVKNFIGSNVQLTGVKK